MASKVLAATTAVGVIASVYLFLDNRSLRSQLAKQTAPTAAAAAQPADATGSATAPTDTWSATGPRTGKIAAPSAGPGPALPEEPQENRLERRARRTEEFAAKFGRLEGETDEEYRARIAPLITAGLAIPRMRASENRRWAEEKAKVTPEQSAQLDQAFEKVYSDVLDYTNKAITDGTLSPYERNVAGWLDYAGGLGGLLGEANGSIGKILSPEQIKTMSASGFEWGEYLGLSAPWEKLTPPPPPPR
ncbi:MAG: hypothetical protein SFX73_05275 [Kofleriaceae bacterium]|nr:hypothetical protein [Kofleriaceae bacterium]